MYGYMISKANSPCIIMLRVGGDRYNIGGYYAYDSSLGNAISDTRYYVLLKLYTLRMTFSHV